MLSFTLFLLISLILPETVFFHRRRLRRQELQLYRAQGEKKVSLLMDAKRLDAIARRCTSHLYPIHVYIPYVHRKQHIPFPSFRFRSRISQQMILYWASLFLVKIYVRSSLPLHLLSTRASLY